MPEHNAQSELSGFESEQWRASTLAALIDHIIGRHHVLVRQELPRMEDAIVRAAEAGGRGGAATVAPLAHTFRFFKRELEAHLVKEEEMLFPLVRQIEEAAELAGERPRLAFGSIAHPINLLREDHQAEQRQLQRMLKMTENYSGPAEIATIYRSIAEQLRALEADMRVHVYLEDEILFPRARSLENGL